MLNGLRILIADQHVSIRTWMRELLSVIGATSVSMAANASELMRMARNAGYDIIICDHHLDDKRDGQQLLEELRFLHILPLRSVFMIATAERKYNHVVAAAEFAPDDYLVKPYTPGQLATRLDRALRKKKALRHVFDHLEVCAHEDAIHACDRAIHVTPRYALDALRIKAESLVALGRAEEATVIYQSIAATQAVPWARMGYAMMLQREKKYDEAKDEAYQLNEEYPEFLSVYDLLARIHEDAGEFQKAIELLERASSITSSTNTDRLRKIAEVAGDREKVISTLKRVVERTQRSSMLKVDDYLSLTRNLLDEQRVDEAAAIADEMRIETRNLQSGELASEVATAMVQRGKGRFDKARSSLDALGEQIMVSMAEALQQLDENWSEERAAEARELLINAFTLMPRDKRVINAHIRYNSVAVQHGGQRHSPTTRTDV